MNNLPDADYRGCSIEVQSYRSDGNQWSPKAVIEILRTAAPIHDADRQSRPDQPVSTRCSKR